jgi:hypothetical protein
MTPTKSRKFVAFQLRRANNIQMIFLKSFIFLNLKVTNKPVFPNIAKEALYITVDYSILTS